LTTCFRDYSKIIKQCNIQAGLSGTTEVVDAGEVPSGSGAGVAIGGRDWLAPTLEVPPHLCSPNSRHFPATDKCDAATCHFPFRLT
jgi:hypothetical protein